MRIYKMNCNSCGAPLDIDLDRLQAFCPYCGEKLLLELDQLDKIIKETEITKRTKLKEENETERLKIQLNENKKSWIRNLIGPVLGVIAFFLFLWAMGLFGEDSYSSKMAKHQERIDKLHELEVDIEDAITDGDYDLAEILVNRLYLTDDYTTKEDEQLWSEKRENYLAIINDRRNR